MCTVLFFGDNQEFFFFLLGSGGDGDSAGGVPAVQGICLAIMGDDPGPAAVPFTAAPGPKHASPRNCQTSSSATLSQRQINTRISG